MTVGEKIKTREIANMKTPIKNTMSVIAFLDILGGKELINKDADESLNLVYTCYKNAIQRYKEMANSRLPLSQINIFSDNISISCPIEDDFENTYDCIISVILLCMVLTIQFWAHGLLVRGGITIGNCFADDFMVWGKALVRAYEIESTIAIYPRIVIDPLTDEIFDLLAKSENKKMICKDLDDLYFIDILYSKQFSVTLPFLEQLIDDNQKRIDNLAEDNLKERQKLKWLQNYFYEKYDYAKKQSLITEFLESK